MAGISNLSIGGGFDVVFPFFNAVAAVTEVLFEDFVGGAIVTRKKRFLQFQSCFCQLYLNREKI